MKTNNGTLKSLRLNSHTDLNEAGMRMRKQFGSELAYPDYSRELGDLAWSFLVEGENQKSLKAGDLGIELYPESARVIAIDGIAQSAVADKLRGAALLKKAFALDPESPAEPSWLLDFAKELENAGKPAEAANVVEAGLNLHPKDQPLLEYRKHLQAH
jgi:tetratricopeptide (TPR) repeat protein